MSISEAVRSLQPNSTESKRKQSEVRRYYRRINEQDLDNAVAIIPYDDERLNYISWTAQDAILHINQTIKKQGEHVEANKYSIDESTREELEDEFKLLFMSLESDRSDEWISKILLFLALVFLLIILSGDLPYLIELVKGLPPN